MRTENDLALNLKDHADAGRARSPLRAAPTDQASARRGRRALPSRREFLKRLGGGIVICVSLGDWTVGQAAERRRGGRGVPTDFNAFLRIAEDGRVTCLTGKIEMGQGPITSLPQMLAEELDTQ